MSEAGKRVAIICEYNPFHEGHAILISRARELYPDCTVISIMSGNTVQRGDFALFDRYVRAEAATLCGSDLTLELPYPFSASASNQFARAGVRIAMELGADVLMFGSCAESEKELFDAANTMKTADFDRLLGERAKEFRGISFLKLRAELYRELTGKDLPTDGNSSLGIEYIMAAEEFASVLHCEPLICHPIKRVGSVSATACRSIIRDSERAETPSDDSDLKSAFIPSDIPERAREIFMSAPVGYGLDALGSLILGFLRITASSRNSEATKNSNGIREALINAAVKAKDYSEFCSLLPTATYTRARLRRELLDMLILGDESNADLLKNTPPQYTVLLGASRRGLIALRRIKKSCDLPIITKPSDTKSLSEEAFKAYRIAERAEALFALTLSPSVAPSELIPRFKASNDAEGQARRL
ncbi:MAG: nucleotidyltransferase family protein [Clostridia bacterium]|nr:nucleotidyltransferase family protein [Clostridia bacterium]